MKMEEEKIPFIAMFYIEDGERKRFDCDFTNEFMEEFEGEKHNVTEIPYFVVMGNPIPIHDLETALKFCRA